MSLFFRLDTDGHQSPVQLEHLFAGPQRSACWLIGGGPSLDALPCNAIANSPLPKMCVNLAGTRKLRPTFWTSYDPTARFHRSIYLDPSVLKFVHRRRAMDLVPETTFKVCDCPGVVFFDRDSHRQYANLLSPTATGIVDWSDTMVQAIDILYRLGFRTVYFAGCELRVQPAAEHVQRAKENGVEPRPHELLADFLRRCAERGVTADELERLAPLPQYHFDEHKPFAAAVQTDQHYFRIAQSLRLSRSCLVRHGMELISVTPGSRLNDYFPFRAVKDVLRDVRDAVGDPDHESATGCYTRKQPVWTKDLGPMRDVLAPGESLGVERPKRRAPAVHLLKSTSDIPRTELLIEDEGWKSVEDALARAMGL